MNTIAWVLILVAGLMVRGMTKGRGITQLPGDLADMFNALAGGNQTELRSVLARTGDSQTSTAVQDNTIPDMPATGSKADLVTFGKRLQSMGYAVSENPSFGGVSPTAHAKNSQHYSGEAIDVNADGFRGGERVALDNANAMAKAAGYSTLWQVAGHYDHLHVAVKH